MQPTKPRRSPFLQMVLAATDTFLCLLLIFVIFIAYGIVPNRWYHILVVYSGSMSPTFNAGDVIVITRPPETLEPGMVLTLMVDGEIVTHRLAALMPDGGLLTHGDANPTLDNWGDSKVTVQGLYRFRIPYLGFLLQYLIPGNLGTRTGSWFQDAEQIGISLNSAASTATPLMPGLFEPTGTPTPAPETSAAEKAPDLSTNEPETDPTEEREEPAETEDSYATPTQAVSSPTPTNTPLPPSPTNEPTPTDAPADATATQEATPSEAPTELPAEQPVTETAAPPEDNLVNDEEPVEPTPQPATATSVPELPEPVEPTTTLTPTPTPTPPVVDALPAP